MIPVLENNSPRSPTTSPRLKPPKNQHPTTTIDSPGATPCSPQSHARASRI
uniref:Uncharacterized protein n=1 Tax=Arundo donax TaxID=35708 RepID=A0A0A9C3Z0_ARUDO